MPGHVLLIGAEDEENLAIRYLAAVLKQEGHRVTIAPCSGKRDFDRVLKSAAKSPDVVAISLAFQQLAPLYFELVQRMRTAGYEGHITVGGHFATFEYEKILKTQKVDSVIRFEGETPLKRLVAAVIGDRDFSAVPNLVYRGNEGTVATDPLLEFCDLDALPYPVRSRHPQTRIGERFATLVASRGCWHSSCLYCCIGAFHAAKKGARCTHRSAENVAEEIAYLYHNKGVRLFQFHDDNFMMPTKEDSMRRLRALRRALLKARVKDIALVIKARPESVDYEVAEELARLGVMGVFLGVENASQSGLKALVRGNSLSAVHAAIQALDRHGITVTYNLLIFHPTATMHEIRENITFIRQYPHLPFDVARAEIVAGSPLERLVDRKGTKIGEWPTWGYVLDDPDVDRMFEAYLRSFDSRGSLCHQLAQDAIMLAYHARVASCLHPGPVVRSVEVQDIVRRTSEFFAKRLSRLPEASDIDAFNRELQEGCRHLLDEMAHMRSRLERVQFIEHQFDRFGLKHMVQKSGAISKLFALR